MSLTAVFNREILKSRAPIDNGNIGNERTWFAHHYTKNILPTLTYVEIPHQYYRVILVV